MINIEEPDGEIESDWMAAMRRGDFEGAWRVTDRAERRRRMKERAGAFVWSPEYLLWNGEPFDGCDVVVRCNHGLGDTLQFFRFIPRLVTIARSVVVLVQPPLLRLLQQMPGCGDVRDGWAAQTLPEPRAEVEIMELAYAFRSDAKTVGASIPYIDHEHVSRVASPVALPSSDRKKIGILWAASDWDPARSVPVGLLRLSMDGVSADFHGLQQDAGEPEMRVAHAGFCDISRKTKDIADLAGAMLQMDLIITVDCMAAHLAGALGQPFWLLLKAGCDWRWLESGDESPWYPSARLFRQEAGSGWESVLLEVNGALRLWSANV